MLSARPQCTPRGDSGLGRLIPALVAALTACAPSRPSAPPPPLDGTAKPAPSVAQPASAQPVSPTPPDDDPHWLRGAASTAREFPLMTPACLADAGCPFAPRKLPPCRSGIAFRSFEADTDLAPLVGSRVVLRGTLRAWPLTTLLDCGTQCCNRAAGEIMLTPRSAQRSSPHYPTLVEAKNPLAFSCHGDESKTCCGVELDRDTLVEGRVVRRGARLALEDVRLCADPS